MKLIKRATEVDYFDDEPLRRSSLLVFWYCRRARLRDDVPGHRGEELGLRDVGLAT